MPSLARAHRAITAWFAEESHPANLAVVRITVFWILFDRLRSGGFRRFARLPEDLRVPPPGWETLLRVFPLNETSVLAAQIAAAVFALLALVGLWTRPAAALASLLGVYVLGSQYLFGKIDHTLHHIIWFGLLLAASPSGDALSIDAWRARRRGKPAPGPARCYALPIRFMWLLMGVAYFFPGFYKLLAGPRWILGDNLRFILYDNWHHHHLLPLLRVDRYPLLYQSAALGTVLFELSFVFLVLSRRTRPLAAIGGLLFHATTAYFMDIYFLELMACYVVFVDWHALAQRLGLARSRAAAARGAHVAVIEQNPRPYGKIEDGLPRWHVALRRKEYQTIDGKLSQPNVDFVPLTGIGRDVGFRELTRDWGFSAVVLACGAWGVSGWPIGIYPRASRVREQAIGVEVEAMIESAAGSQRVALPLRSAMLRGIRRLPVGEPRDRRLRALTDIVLSERGPLEPGQTLRIYATTWSTLPEDWNAPPLRRELLFDYHADRHARPHRQP